MRIKAIYLVHFMFFCIFNLIPNKLSKQLCNFQSKLRLSRYEKKRCVWYLDKQPINHKFYFKRIKTCITRILLAKDKLGCSNFILAWSSYSEKPWCVFEYSNKVWYRDEGYCALI